MSLSGEAVLYASSPSDISAQECARKERRRRRIVKELFETEKTYLQHLELISKFFDFPLRFACVVPEDVHSHLFSNLEQIYDVNKTLLNQMEQTSIGQAFSQLGPFLKLYSTYANNHQLALSTLQDWQSKSTSFASFLCKQEDREEVKGLKLNALLIMPVQRIPRYKLLLEDLVENTPDDHYDHSNLKEAAKKIGEIALHINEHIRQNENFMKMLAIQRSFDNSAPNLLVPGRQFIKEGLLRKVSRKGGKSFERMFFLFSDVLLYGKSKFLDGGGRSYTCSCVLPLKHCKVEPVFITNLKHTETGGVFKITCKEESLLLYSDDQDNAKEWANEVDKSIRKLCDDRQTLRKPSSNKIPLRGRSLRRQRQQLKKCETKLPDKTPQRPLSQISLNSEVDCDSDCSPNIRARLAPVRQHFRQIYTNNMANCQGFEEEANTSQIEMNCTSPDMRKAVGHSAYTGSTSASDGISLSDCEIDSSCGDKALTCHENPMDMSTSWKLQEDKFDDVQRQSLRQYSPNFSDESCCNSSTHKYSDEMEQSSPEKPSSIQYPNEVKEATSSQPTEPYFPPNSPAHKYFNKQRSFNMRLRSYIQRPFKRFQQAKKELSNPCSPLQTKTLSDQDKYRSMRRKH